VKKLYIIATIFLVSFAFLGFGVAGSESELQSSDSIPVITVHPDELIDVEVGETFEVNVCVSDVACLYGFDIEFKWDPTIIEYISHTVMAPVETYEEGVLHSPILLLKDEVDPTSGSYWIACASLSPADTFSGNGAFFVITFEAVSSFDEQPYELVEAALSDDEGQSIMGYKYDGPSVMMCYDTWEFIRNREKDPKVDGWRKWWTTQMRRKYGF